jgi:quercetin dioxygenase-like cupin family protein
MSDKTILLKSRDGGVLTPEEQPALGMQSVDGMNFSYGVYADLSDAGVTFARGVVPAGKEVPAHAGPNLYAVLVQSGSGQLTLYNDAQEPTGTLAYAPGTLLVFPPNAQHGWIVESDEDFVWFGVDLPER